MTVRLWGVRGSLPCPGPQTVRYGGNTISLEFRFEPSNRLIIVDSGSGIRGLGNYIMKNDLPKGPVKAQMFFTHTHWDHILGFPFFIPIFLPSTELEIYGPKTFEDDSLQGVVGGQLQYRYFPVNSGELAAKISWHHLGETEMDLGDGIRLRTKYLNHPILCMGYRFTHNGKTIVTVYDHEPFRNLFPTDPNHPDYDENLAREGEDEANRQNRLIEKFMANADVVIHDAQYTTKEYLAGKIGWGHTPMETAINNAGRAGVKKLVLIHHDPERTDEQLDELEALYQKKLHGKTEMEVVFAREGMVL